MITGTVTSQPLYPRKIDLFTVWLGGGLQRVWGEFSCSPTMFRAPHLLPHSLNIVLTAPSPLQIIYIYICIYTHLLNSEVPLQWDCKHFKVIFEMSCVQISAQRSLLLTKLQIFFTPCGKCRDTGIIQNCNVTDSFHILSSSFFTNHRTTRCYTLCLYLHW